MSTAAKTQSLDERVFRSHLAGARFQDGVDRGKWRLVGEIDWPYAVIAVSAAPRTGAPEEYYLRFDLTGYPAMPTAMPWDLETREKLAPEKRPKGERAGMLFRTDWSDGLALYAPYDRVAWQGHEDGWRQKHQRELWDTSKDITHILRNVHHVLNAQDYAGV
jgi:hypothetical protein